MVKSLILIGYMGCGKSVIGKRIAARKSFAFIDLDDYIESQEKTTISKIFEKEGELFFRKKERLHLKKLISKNIKAVISLGGGAPCYFDNIDYITQKEDFHSLYLKTSPKVLASRLFEEKSHRPMISHLDTLEDLEKFIAKHLFERAPYYLKAENQLSTDNKSVEALVAKIENLFA
jgi:shikimate kinase